MHVYIYIHSNLLHSSEAAVDPTDIPPPTPPPSCTLAARLVVAPVVYITVI